MNNDQALASATPWWQQRWVIVACALAAAVPLLWPPIPPLLDLPGHMASFKVALDVAASPALQRYYAFQWQVIGNIGVDALIMPIGHLLGIELATKLLVVLIPMVMALSVICLSRVAHGRVQPTVFAALPLVYCYPFMFGFLNYCLSAALALMGLSLWIWLGDTGRVRTRALLFVLLAPMVWLSHAIGWLMLGAMCGASELHRRLGGATPGRASIGTAVACLPLLTPVLLMPFSPHSEGFQASGWFNPNELAKWSIMVLRDRWLVFDLVSTAALVGLVACALLGRGGLRIEPRLGWPALALFAMFVVAPSSINGSDFVNGRIVPYAAVLIVLAVGSVGSGANARLLALALAAFAIVRPNLARRSEEPD